MEGPGEARADTARRGAVEPRPAAGGEFWQLQKGGMAWRGSSACQGTEGEMAGLDGATENQAAVMGHSRQGI